MGEANHFSKITSADAVAIRTRHRAGGKLNAIAADFGVSPALVSLIGRGKLWKHV